MKLSLAVESMRHHTTDEGWQIFKGLEENGYLLCGYNLSEPDTDVKSLLERYNPNVVVIQDKREWDVKPGDFRESRAQFTNIEALKDHPCFKVTILKDAHQRPGYHRQAAEEMGIDLHIIYYDERLVRDHASWLGRVVRTWHTIDKGKIPPYRNRRGTTVLSGAISSAYPLRRRIAEERFNLPLDYIKHPGYHRNGSNTPGYLEILSRYRVSICTCSIYQYSLRKIMESTACGCRVITNLSEKYFPPGIEGNLHRINSDIPIAQLRDVIMTLDNSYDPDYQKEMAEACKRLYDYRMATKRLAEEIDAAASKLCQQKVFR